MATRLILVEGFPGCGKSATAQWLARQLTGAGRQAVWFYEEQDPHPVTRGGPARSVSWKAYFAEQLGRWSAFAATGRAAATINILESAWLQDPLLTMLRRDLDRILIRAFIGKTVEAMRGLDPVLISLSHPEPEAAMRRLWERRGASWVLFHVMRNDASAFARARALSGVDGLLRYWREHNDLAEAVVRDAGMPTLRLDCRAGDSGERRRAIAEFLGFAPTAEPQWTDRQLARIVGTYQDGARRLCIGLRGGGLTLDGLLWPSNRLLPLGPDVAEAESWPLHLTFLEAADGLVSAVRIEGPAIGQRRLAGTYGRVQ
jgi:hypothetical protein